MHQEVTRCEHQVVRVTKISSQEEQGRVHLPRRDFSTCVFVGYDQLHDQRWAQRSSILCRRARQIMVSAHFSLERRARTRIHAAYSQCAPSTFSVMVNPPCRQSHTSEPVRDAAPRRADSAVPGGHETCQRAGDVVRWKIDPAASQSHGAVSRLLKRKKFDALGGPSDCRQTLDAADADFWGDRRRRRRCHHRRRQRACLLCRSVWLEIGRGTRMLLRKSR